MSAYTPLSELDRQELRRFAAEVVEYHDDLKEKDLDWGPHLHQDQERELCEITVRLLDRLEQFEEQYEQDHAELQAYREQSVEAAADRRLHAVLKENRRLRDENEQLRESVRRLGVLNAELAEDYEALYRQEAELANIDRLVEEPEAAEFMDRIAAGDHQAFKALLAWLNRRLRERKADDE